MADARLRGSAGLAFGVACIVLGYSLVQPFRAPAATGLVVAAAFGSGALWLAASIRSSLAMGEPHAANALNALAAAFAAFAGIAATDHGAARMADWVEGRPGPPPTCLCYIAGPGSDTR